MKVYNKNDKTIPIPADAVYVGRGSPWGNPYRIRSGWARKKCLKYFERVTLPTLDLKPLRGKSLICFCAPKDCHADILMREANK